MSGTADRRLLLSIAGAAFALQILPNFFGGYGYFIDELYYIACARRLDFGYVDHPPLAPFLLRLAMSVFGESVVAIRLLPALAAAALAYLTGWLTAFFGGGRWAQGFAAVTVTLAAGLLLFFDFFSMNAFEVLFWTAAVVTLVVMIRTNEPKLWLVFGAVAGLSLENKHTMVLVCAALIVGLLLTPARGLLFSRWLWLGGAVALVLFLPNVLWQIEHGWPSLEFYQNATLEKNISSPPGKILFNQILFMNPVTLPIWLMGFVFLLDRERGFRAIGFAYVLLLGLLLLTQSSRPDRIAGMYPMLFAAGATWWGTFFARRRPELKWAFVTFVVAGCLAFAPLFQPWLPPSTLARYVAFIGVDTQIERGEGKLAQLPQWLADRFGREELVAQIADIYKGLPPEEQKRTILLMPSYGHAGAVELMGEPLGLPAVMTAQNTYHMWGRAIAPQLADSVVIAVGWDREALEHSFADVSDVATYTCQYCMNWRNNMAIRIARNPTLTASEFQKAWEESKHYE